MDRFAGSGGEFLAATGVPAIGVGGRALGKVGMFGKESVFAEGAVDAWRMTFSFMGEPFSVMGPVLWLDQRFHPVP